MPVERGTTLNREPMSKDPNSPGRSFSGYALWRWLLAIVLLAALFAVAGPGEIAGILSQIQPTWAIATILLSYVLVLLAGFNVWLLLRTLSPVTLKTFMPIFISSWAMSLVLPGQLGDATQVLFLKKRGIRIARSGAAYVLDKGISLFFLLMVASLGASYYILDFSGVLIWILPLALVGIGVGTLIVVKWIRPPEKGFLHRLRVSIMEFRDHLLSFRAKWRVVLLNIFLTVVKWCILILCYWSAFLAFGKVISLRAAGTIPIMSTLIGYVPITVGGIGTVEWTAVYLFGFEGITKATVLTAYLFLRAIQYILAACSIIILNWSKQEDSDLNAGS